MPDTLAISFWGVGDADSWIRYWLGHLNEEPLLFDDAYNPKPAYQGVVDAGTAGKRRRGSHELIGSGQSLHVVVEARAA